MKNYIDPMIKVGDVLTISVSSTDPLAVAPFNLPLVSFVKEGGVISNSTVGGSASGSKDIASSVCSSSPSYIYNDAFVNILLHDEVKI
mgnify:CR=1 FL=1